jgi:hypothetical protein
MSKISSLRLSLFIFTLSVSAPAYVYTHDIGSVMVSTLRGALKGSMTGALIGFCGTGAITCTFIINQLRQPQGPGVFIPPTDTYFLGIMRGVEAGAYGALIAGQIGAVIGGVRGFLRATDGKKE